MRVVGWVVSGISSVGHLRRIKYLAGSKAAAALVAAEFHIRRLTPRQVLDPGFACPTEEIPATTRGSAVRCARLM